MIHGVHRVSLFVSKNAGWRIPLLVLDLAGYVVILWLERIFMWILLTPNRWLGIYAFYLLSHFILALNQINKLRRKLLLILL